MQAKHFPLIVGISVPILMILFVAGSIYIPGLFVHPQYDFLYLTGTDYYYCNGRYTVVQNKLTKTDMKVINPGTTQPMQECNPTFYVHDVEKDTNRLVTFEEAQQLKLDPSPLSADEYEVVRGGGGGDFLFFSAGRDYNSMYLRGHNVSKKIHLENTGSSNYYNYNFSFLGWITP